MSVEENFNQLFERYDEDDEDSLSRMPLYKFVKTTYWDIIRKYLIYKNDSTCQLCNFVGFVYVHHISYKNRGREHLNLDDLIVICQKCHSEIHNKHSHFKRRQGHQIRINGRNINELWITYLHQQNDPVKISKLIETNQHHYLKNADFIRYLLDSKILMGGHIDFQ